MPFLATERQIAANRENRRRWKGHTPEGSERLRRAAIRNRQWMRSTGPRTDAGKSRSRQNALKHGARSAEAVHHRKAMNEALRAMGDLTPDLPG